MARLIGLVAMPYMQKMGYIFPSSCIGILANLWMKDGITQKELGMSLIKTKSSITKMLDSLIAAGLITKESDLKDKRKKLIFLTAKGKKFRGEIEMMNKQMEDNLLLDVSEEEIKITKKVLKSFYLNLSEELFKQHQDEY